MYLRRTTTDTCSPKISHDSLLFTPPIRALHATSSVINALAILWLWMNYDVGVLSLTKWKSMSKFVEQEVVESSFNNALRMFFPQNTPSVLKYNNL